MQGEHGIKVAEGQCGLCAHFGEHRPDDVSLQQIRAQRSVPVDYKEECGHPTHARLHLLVTATSGCDGFTPVPG
ncbi:MAG: hypothetical protein KDD69_00780 [Bdellovibrionales bacterium]|nr:hypothetical protein [Bdellovibrionales bacterium]